MTLEHVNVQELQRLGDAINMTMEAIRRVAPQIALLQQQANPYGGFGPGVGVGVNPWMQAQPSWAPQYGQQLYPPQPYGAQPFVPGFSTPAIDPVTSAYIQGHIQAIRSLVTHQPGAPFGQATWPNQQGTPFVNLQPRPF